MASMVEVGDRVRVAGLSNQVGTVTEVRKDIVKVRIHEGLTISTSKARVFIASKVSN